MQTQDQYLLMDEISTPLTKQEDHPLLHDTDILNFFEDLAIEYNLKFDSSANKEGR